MLVRNMVLIVVCAASAFAQAAPPQGGGAPRAAGRGGAGRGPAVVSPEILADNRVVFRIAAPKAEQVRLSASDATVLFTGGGAGPLAGSTQPIAPLAAPIPQGGPEFKKNDTGIWEATLGPLPPGAYRYVYMVDGVR